MNKYKGIWIAIISIMVIGVMITFATSSFIKGKGMTLEVTEGIQQSEDFSNQTEAGSRLPGTDKERVSRKEETAPKDGVAYSVPEESHAVLGRSAIPETEMAGMEKQPAMAEARAGDTNDAAGAAGEQNAAPVISPLGPGSKASLIPSEDAEEYYLNKLEEIDVKIGKMREEASDSSTYSMKSLAEKEVMLWSTELNSIYTAISDMLDEDGKAKLETAQQAWMKSRDGKAEEAAKKFSGGSLEGVEYTASLAESTRKRAYDLLEEYSRELSALDNQ